MFNTPPKFDSKRSEKMMLAKTYPIFEIRYDSVYFQALLAVKLPGGLSTHPTIGLGLQQVNRVETQGAIFCWRIS